MDVYKAWQILFVSLIISTLAIGQGRPTDLKQRVALPEKTIRLDSLLKRISKQTGLIFSYNSRKINLGLFVQVTSTDNTLEKILLKIKETTRLDYLLADNHVILKSAIKNIPANTRREQDRVVSPNVTAVAKAQEANKSLDSVATKKEPEVSEKLNTTSFVDSSTQVADTIKKKEAPTEPIIQQPVVVDQKTVVEKDSVSQKIKTEKPAAVPQKKVRKGSVFQMKAGITVDETTYMGALIQIGIPTLYGIVSYKTDFDVGLLSYGLGTSIKLSDVWRVNLYANFGNVSKAYDSLHFSLVDSTLVPYHRTIMAESSLTRIGISIEKKITNHLTLQGGIQYNSLTTKYSVGGVPVPIGPYGNNADKQIYTIAPPYLLSNSYSPSSTSNVRSWLGIQVNLLYTIDFSLKK